MCAPSQNRAPQTPLFKAFLLSIIISINQFDWDTVMAPVMFILPFFLLASAIVANKLLLTVLSPITLVAFRMVGGGLFLYWYHRVPHTVIRTFFLQLTAAALCTTFINSLLKSYALTHLTSTKAAFIGALDPIVTALLAFIMIGDSVNSKQLVGIIIGMIGGALISFDHFSFSFDTLLPVMAAFGALVIGRYGWLLSQKLLKQTSITAAQLNAGMMLITGGIALGYVLCSPGSLMSEVCALNQPYLLAAFLFTIVVGNGIAYPLYAQLLKKHPATLVSLTGLLIPVMVMMMGALLLGESCSPQVMVGACCIGLGMLMFTFYSRST